MTTSEISDSLPDVTPEPFDLGISQAADIVGVHPDTIREWVDAGKLLAFITPGGHRRFRRSDVVALLPGDGPEAA